MINFEKYKSDEFLLKFYNLKNLVRYNHRLRIKNESVAEHSFFVALFTIQLCDEFDIGGETKEVAIIKALLHDLPEIEFNDITHDVKEKLNLKELIDKAERNYLICNLSVPTLSFVFDNNIVANTIVEYADALSVLQYCKNEQLLGNSTMQPIIDEVSLRCLKIENKLHNLLEV